jgi:Kef-type K+ transport system membrane component KefB
VNIDLFPLLLITALAAVIPVAVHRLGRFGPPLVVVEILAGIAMGQSGLDLVKIEGPLKFLAGFGFSFLMFLSGLEIDFSRLRAPGGGRSREKWWQGTLWLAGASFVLTLALAVGAGYGLVLFGVKANGLLLGLILSTTSLGLVVPVLKERGQSEGRFGQVLLASALVADFVTLLLLSVAIALLGRGPSLELLLVLVLAAAFGMTVRLGLFARRIPLITWTIRELAHATSQIRVRGAVALMVGWVFLAEALGLEVILGAFLAGALVSILSVEREGILRDKLDALGYGFFVPLFFITVGVGFDLESLLASPSSLILVPVLIAAAYAVKMVPALMWRVSFSWRESVAAGILLSSRLSLIIAAAAVALNLGLIGPAVNSAVILVAIVTCTVSPMIFTRLSPVSAGTERSGTIIVGTSQLAAFAGQRLRRTGEVVTFIGQNQTELGELKKKNFPIQKADKVTAKVLAAAGAERAEAVLALSEDQTEIRRICGLAVKKFEVPNVVAWAEKTDLAQDLTEMGVRVVQPSLAAVLAVEGALHFPATFQLLTDLSGNVELAEVALRNPRIAGRPLSRIKLPGGVLVLGVRREGETIIPNGDTRLEPADLLTLVGKPEALGEARRLLRRR